MPEVEFVADWFAEVERGPGRMEQVAFRKGARVRAEVRPLQGGGKEERADLRLADGGIARAVPLSRIAVAAGQARAA
jgi:hypothetical protein